MKDTLPSLATASAPASPRSPSRSGCYRRRSWAALPPTPAPGIPADDTSAIRRNTRFSRHDDQSPRQLGASDGRHATTKPPAADLQPDLSKILRPHGGRFAIGRSALHALQDFCRVALLGSRERAANRRAGGRARHFMEDLDAARITMEARRPDRGDRWAGPRCRSVGGIGRQRSTQAASGKHTHLGESGAGGERIQIRPRWRFGCTWRREAAWRL